MSQEENENICKICGHDNSDHDDPQCNGVLKSRKICKRPLKGRKLPNEAGWKHKLKKALKAGDAHEIADICISQAKDVKEARMIMKDFMPFIAPKLQSVDTHNKNNNEVVIKWATSEEPKIVEGEAVEQFPSM